MDRALWSSQMRQADRRALLLLANDGGTSWAREPVPAVQALDASPVPTVLRRIGPGWCAWLPVWRVRFSPAAERR